MRRFFLHFSMLGLSIAISLQACSGGSDLRGGGNVAKSRSIPNKELGTNANSKKGGSNTPGGSADGIVDQSGPNGPAGTNGSGNPSGSGSSSNSGNPSPQQPGGSTFMSPTANPSNVPEGIKQIGSVEVAAPDIKLCAQTPSKGKQKDGTCGNNEVVVIVNDGEAAEMTCCPVGNNVLSSSAAEKHILRNRCVADEVATGVQRPKFYCTKINTTYLKLSSETSVVFATSVGGLTQAERVIASAYNENDTCICKNGSVVVGPHTNANNQCTEKCVQILKK